jgi:predicted ribonuclease YlaK
LRKHHYVLDTNVIIEDPRIVNKLEGIIHIPTAVLKELDKLKYSENLKSYNIREFIRSLDNDDVHMHFNNSTEEKDFDSDIINVYLKNSVSGNSNDEKIMSP